MNLPPPPYDDTVGLVKTQALVSDKDKDLLMTIIPDRGLYTLIIQHAYKRAADFIRTNDLDYQHDGDAKRLLEFITAPYTPGGHANTCVTGKGVSRDVSGRAAKIRRAFKSV